MQVRLQIAHGKANIKQVVLKADTTIGRGTECDLKIASNLISRKHCEILISEARVQIRDLGSANGTFLNGEPVPALGAVDLEPGAVLLVGPVKLVVEFTPASGETAPAMRGGTRQWRAPARPTPGAAPAPAAEAAARTPPLTLDPRAMTAPDATLQSGDEAGLPGTDDSVDGGLEQTVFDPLLAGEDDVPTEGFALPSAGEMPALDSDAPAADSAAPRKRKGLLDLFRRKPQPPETADNEAAQAPEPVHAENSAAADSADVIPAGPDEPTAVPSTAHLGPRFGSPAASGGDAGVPNPLNSDSPEAEANEALHNFLKQM